jgi:hypothetical protein
MLEKCRGWLVGIVLIGIGCVLCSTHAAWANHDRDTVNLKSAGVLSQAGTSDFLFGVGYATTDLASTFAYTGVLQAKLNYGMSSWGAIEPDPPVDGDHIKRTSTFVPGMPVSRLNLPSSYCWQRWRKMGQAYNWPR